MIFLRSGIVVTKCWFYLPFDGNVLLYLCVNTKRYAISSYWIKLNNLILTICVAEIFF